MAATLSSSSTPFSPSRSIPVPAPLSAASPDTLHPPHVVPRSFSSSSVPLPPPSSSHPRGLSSTSSISLSTPSSLLPSSAVITDNSAPVSNNSSLSRPQLQRHLVSSHPSFDSIAFSPPVRVSPDTSTYQEDNHYRTRHPNQTRRSLQELAQEQYRHNHRHRHHPNFYYLNEPQEGSSTSDQYRLETLQEQFIISRQKHRRPSARTRSTLVDQTLEPEPEPESDPVPNTVVVPERIDEVRPRRRPQPPSPKSSPSRATAASPPSRLSRLLRRFWRFPALSASAAAPPAATSEKTSRRGSSKPYLCCTSGKNRSRSSLYLPQPNTPRRTRTTTATTVITTPSESSSRNEHRYPQRNNRRSRSRGRQRRRSQQRSVKGKRKPNRSASASASTPPTLARIARPPPHHRRPRRSSDQQERNRSVVHHREPQLSLSTVHSWCPYCLKTIPGQSDLDHHRTHHLHNLISPTPAPLRTHSLSTRSSQSSPSRSPSLSPRSCLQEEDEAASIYSAVGSYLSSDIDLESTPVVLGTLFTFAHPLPHLAESPVHFDAAGPASDPPLLHSPEQARLATDQSILPQEAGLVAALSPPLLMQPSLSTSSSVSIGTSASSSSSTSSSTAPPPLLDQLPQLQHPEQQLAPPRPQYFNQRQPQESRLEAAGNRSLFLDRLGQHHHQQQHRPSPLSLPATVTLESPAPTVLCSTTSRTPPASSSTPVGSIGTAKVVTTATATTTTATATAATAVASISLYRHFLRELDRNPWFSTSASSQTTTTSLAADPGRETESTVSKRFTLPASFHIRTTHERSASGTAAAAPAPTVTASSSTTAAEDKERRRSSWSFFPFNNVSRPHSRTPSFSFHSACAAPAIPAIPAVPASWTASTRASTTKATTSATAPTTGDNHSLPAVQTLVQGFPQAQGGSVVQKERDQATPVSAPATATAATAATETATAAATAAVLAKSRALFSIIRAHHRETDNEDVEVISKPHSTLLFTSLSSSSSPSSSASSSSSSSAFASTSASSSSPAFFSASPSPRLHTHTQRSFEASFVPALVPSSSPSAPAQTPLSPSHPALASGATTTATMPTIVALPPTSAPTPKRRKRFSFSTSFERVKKSGSAILLEAQAQALGQGGAGSEVATTASTATVGSEEKGKEKKREEQQAMLATEEPTNSPLTAMNRPVGSSSSSNNGHGIGNGNGQRKRQPATSPAFTSTLAHTSSLPPPPPPSSSSSSSSKGGMFRPRHQSLNIGSLSILGRRGPKDDPSSAKPPLNDVTGATSAAVAATLAGTRNRNSIAGPIMSTSCYDPEKPLPAIVDGEEEEEAGWVTAIPVEAESFARTKPGTDPGGWSNLSLTLSIESTSLLGHTAEQQVPSTPSSPTTESKPHQRRRSFLPTALMTSNLAKFVSGVNAATSPTTGSFSQNSNQGPSSPTSGDNPKSPAAESLGGSSFRERSLPQRAEDVVLDETTLLTIEQFKWGVLCCCHAIKSRVQKRQLARKERFLSAQVSRQGCLPVDSQAGTGAAAESGAGSKALALTGSTHSSKSGSSPNSSSRKKSSTWSTFNNSIGISINNSSNNNNSNNSNNSTHTSHNYNNASSQENGNGQGSASSNFTTLATNSYEARLSEARSTLQALIRVMMESIDSGNPMATTALNTSTGSINHSTDATNNSSNAVHPLAHYPSFPSLHVPFSSSQATPAITSGTAASTTSGTGAISRHLGSQKSQSRLQLSQATDAILGRLSIQGLVQVLGYTLALAPHQWIPWHLYDFFERPQGRSFKDLVELLQTHSQRVIKAVLETVECLIEYGMILEEELEEERQDKDQVAASNFTSQEVATTPVPSSSTSSAVVSMALRLRSSQGQIRTKNEDGDGGITGAASEQGGGGGGRTHSARSSVGLAMALSVLEPSLSKNPSSSTLTSSIRGTLPFTQPSTPIGDQEQHCSSRDRRRRVIVDGLACLVFRPQRMDEGGVMNGRGGGGHDSANGQLPPVPPVTNGSKSRSVLPSGDDWSWLKRGSATLTGSGSAQQRTSVNNSMQPMTAMSPMEAQGATREQKIGRQAFENLVLAYEADQRSRIPPTAAVVVPAPIASTRAVSREGKKIELRGMVAELSNLSDVQPPMAMSFQETKRIDVPRHAHSLPAEPTTGGPSTPARSLSLPPWRKQQQLQQQQQQSSSSILSPNGGGGPFAESPSDEISVLNLQRPNSLPAPTRNFSSNPVVLPTSASSSDLASSIVTLPVVRARHRNVNVNPSVRSTWTWSTFENHMLVMAEEEHLIEDNSDEEGEGTAAGVPRRLPEEEGEEIEIVQLEIKDGSQSPLLPEVTPPTSPTVARWRKQSETFGSWR